MSLLDTDEALKLLKAKTHIDFRDQNIFINNDLLAWSSLLPSWSIPEDFDPISGGHGDFLSGCSLNSDLNGDRNSSESDEANVTQSLAAVIDVEPMSALTDVDKATIHP
ncbi:hypothetical protein ACH5RR_037165 [Cinchona calisaya]|uniref:Uncharacterized protein n=1 Tax=Cinchona calisaya TaxID=153742 RepID=A0ABD2Y5C0_9GENT